VKELKDGGEKNIFEGVSAYAVRERISEAVHTQSPYFKSYPTQESKKNAGQSRPTGGLLLRPLIVNKTPKKVARHV
jgi:hypothetical protein